MIRRLTDPFPGVRFWGGFGSFAARGIVASSGGGGGDTVAPTVDSVVVASDGLSADITWSEDMDETVTPTTAEGAFNGTNATLDSFAWQSSTVLRANFDGTALPATGIQTITLDLDAGAVADLAGNGNDAVSGQATTNNSTVIAPLGIANLKGLWYGESTRTLDGSGNVDSLNDESGNGEHLSQATAGDRPAPNVGWRNGRDAITFVNALLERASLTAALTQPTTHYAAGDGIGAVDGRISDGQGGSRQIIGNNATAPEIWAGAWTTAGLTAVASGTPFIERAIFDGGASSIRIEPHGGAVQSATGLSPSTNGLDGLRWGGTTTSNAWGEDLALHCVFDGTLSAQDDADMLAWLSQYYDIVHT